MHPITDKKFLYDNKGQSLLELLVAMPVISLLLIALGTAFAFGVKNYAVLLSNWELQNQVRQPLERLVKDLDAAEKVEASAEKLRIYCRQYNNSPEWVEYQLNNSKNRVMTRNSQPLTGDSRLGRIMFTEFKFAVENDKLVSFSIGAENQLTGKRLTLQTAVRITGKGES